MLTCPSVAPVMANTIVFAGNNLVVERFKPSSVIYSLGDVILKRLTSLEFIQEILPFQYSGLARLGVPPNKHSQTSPSLHSLLISYLLSMKKYLYMACACCSKLLFIYVT